MAIEGRSDAGKGGRIRLGMIGGGEGAFIGAVHRLAARMDDHYDLVAGALSATPEKARRSGAALGLPADRVYDDFEAMAKFEAKRGNDFADEYIHLPTGGVLQRRLCRRATGYLELNEFAVTHHRDKRRRRHALRKRHEELNPEVVRAESRSWYGDCERIKINRR